MIAEFRSVKVPLVRYSLCERFMSRQPSRSSSATLGAKGAAAGWASILAAIAVSVGCGGMAASSNRVADGAAPTEEAGHEAAAPDSARPAGSCTTDDDCTAVLDYRAGFSCWFPSAASKADTSQDPCLIPWKPNARCTTPAPPAECPTSGPIPVFHSCFTASCVSPTCNEGTCALDFGFDHCPVVDAGPPDCEALRTTYVNALAAAQQCDPTQDASVCEGDYADGCGCESPYNLYGPYANAVQCAFDDWRNPNCPVASCGRTCITPSSAGAACVSNAAATTGTCAWKP